MKAIKPGYLQDEPVHPLNPNEPKEVIDVCLNCPIPDGCHPKRKDCPLTGGVGRAMREIADKEALDKNVLRAIKAGWSDRRIRDTLYIGYNKLMQSKERLRAKGEIK